MNESAGAADRSLLTSCEACGGAMSSRAAACPRCGHPHARVARRGLAFAIVALLVAIGLVIARGLHYAHGPT